MRRSAWIAFALGAVLLAGLLIRQGVGTVAAAFGAAGWRILALPGFALPYVLLRAAALRLLFAPRREPPWRATLAATWVGQSVNALLPVAAVGGDFLKAHRLARAGVALPESAAALVVDKATQAAGIAAMALIASGLLLERGTDAAALHSAWIGAGLIALGLGGFLAVQRRGVFALLSRALVRTTGRGAGLEVSAQQTDALVRGVHGRPGRLLASGALHSACELLLALEVWTAASWIGHPVGFSQAVLLKGLTGALRAAAFVMPAGLGVLEGSFVAVGALVGLPADAMLSLSLATRVREVLAGVPAILLWQQAEGRALLARRRA